MNSKVRLFLIVIFAGDLFLFGADSPRLIPFQGRLSDRNGTAMADGQRVVQFKIYDAPVGGQTVWNGEVQKLTVNAGLVNTLLGSKSSLADVDFNQSLHLELTVDANADGQITVADPPLLPRQSILPAVFAKEAADSRLLAGHDWTPLFGVNDPTGTFLPVRLADGSVPSVKLVPASITAAQIAVKTITAAKIADNTITSEQIAPGTITRDRLESSLTIDSIIPPGTVNAFAGTSVPPGWLLCDGSALDKDLPAYGRLFSAIATSWGNGSQSGVGAQFPSVPGVTDFNVPDLRGVFLRGVNGLRSDGFADPGDNRTKGDEVGSFQLDAFQGHWHDLWVDRDAAGFLNGGTRVARAETSEINVFPNVRHVRSPIADGQNDDPRTARETRPKNASVNYIIKL